MSRARRPRPPRSRPTTGKTSSTWKAWTGWAPSGGLGREPAPGRRAGARPEAQPRSSGRTAPGGTASSSSPPSQYASTTRSSSGSAMPLERAISSRYGHAPSNPWASSRIRRRSPPAGGFAEQLVGGVGSAVAEPVRTVRVAGEADRAGDVGRDHRVTRRRPARAATASRAMTTTTTATASDGLPGTTRRRRHVPLTAAASAAVIGAPRTRTLATTEAAARRRAASQVAVVDGEQCARPEAPGPLRRGQTRPGSAGGR